MDIETFHFSLRTRGTVKKSILNHNIKHSLVKNSRNSRRFFTNMHSKYQVFELEAPVENALPLPLRTSS